MKFDEVKNLAIKTLKKQGEHIPQFIFYKDGRAEMFTTPWSDDVEKHMTRKLVREYVTEHKPDFYYYICEAWILEAKQGTPLPGQRPSKHPDRQSILLVERYDKDANSEGMIIKFKKSSKGNIKILSEVKMENTDEKSSAFNFYLEEGGHEERMDNLKEKGRFL